MTETKMEELYHKLIIKSDEVTRLAKSLEGLDVKSLKETTAGISQLKESMVNALQKERARIKTLEDGYGSFVKDTDGTIMEKKGFFKALIQELMEENFDTVAEIHKDTLDKKAKILANILGEKITIKTKLKLDVLHERLKESIGLVTKKEETLEKYIEDGPFNETLKAFNKVESLVTASTKQAALVNRRVVLLKEENTKLKKTNEYLADLNKNLSDDMEKFMEDIREDRKKEILAFKARHKNIIEKVTKMENSKERRGSIKIALLGSLAFTAVGIAISPVVMATVNYVALLIK